MAYKKALTIIIPMYNVSEYINRCLDSLTEDERIVNELEIIVVNDGSTDDSADKAKIYADKYPDIITLINKENGGHGSALNVGIERATGQYLRVLDSDDWVKSGGLTKQIRYIKDQKPGEEVDAILNPYEEIWVNCGNTVKMDFNKLHDCKEPFSLKVLADHNYFPFFYNTSVRTGIYKENDIRRIDEGIFYDDIEFSIYTLPYLKRISYLPDVIYQYRLGIPGQSMNPVNKIKRQWMYEHVMDTIYNCRLVGGDAQRLIELRLSMMLAADLDLYLLWKDKRKAKKAFIEVYERYKDVPISWHRAKKLKILLMTKFSSFNLLGFYFNRKVNLLWGNI